MRRLSAGAAAIAVCAVLSSPALAAFQFRKPINTPAPVAVTPDTASCRALLSSGRSTGDGVYQLDVDGSGPQPPFSAYCDMANGGWTLVMRSSGDTTFTYSSPYWTNTALLNETVLPGSGNAKYQAYLSVSGAEMRGCLGAYCFARPISGTALQTFSGPAATTARYDDYPGGLAAFPNCRVSGFNMDFESVSFSGVITKLRFGFTSNGENDCGSNDAMIGFGMHYNAYNKMYGSGRFVLGNTDQPEAGTLWVR